MNARKLIDSMSAQDIQHERVMQEIYAAVDSMTGGETVDEIVDAVIARVEDLGLLFRDDEIEEIVRERMERRKSRTEATGDDPHNLRYFDRRVYLVKQPIQVWAVSKSAYPRNEYYGNARISRPDHKEITLEPGDKLIYSYTFTAIHQGRHLSVKVFQPKDSAFEKSHGNYVDLFLKGMVEKGALEPTEETLPSGTGGVLGESELAALQMEKAEQLANDLEQKLKAPFVRARVSALGGPERASVLLTVSLDPRESWVNGIIENSRLMRFHIGGEGVIEQHVHFSREIPKFRKTRFSYADEAVLKLSRYLQSLQSAPQHESSEDPEWHMARGDKLHSESKHAEAADSYMKAEELYRASGKVEAAKSARQKMDNAVADSEESGGQEESLSPRDIARGLLEGKMIGKVFPRASNRGKNRRTGRSRFAVSMLGK